MAGKVQNQNQVDAMSRHQASKPEGFPRQLRLRKQAEFDAVFGNNAFAADNMLVMHAMVNDKGSTRLGLSIGRKVGNAVVRNRWKRTIREAFRRNRSTLPTGIDIVVRPRKGATCQYENVARSLGGLTKRLSKKLGVSSVADDPRSRGKHSS